MLDRLEWQQKPDALTSVRGVGAADVEGRNAAEHRLLLHHPSFRADADDIPRMQTT
jgi:hypothetical protein